MTTPWAPAASATRITDPALPGSRTAVSATTNFAVLLKIFAGS